MNAALWWLAQNTLTVAVLIPLVLVACRHFRNRPAVQHVLWVVVLLKFVTPPIITWPWTVEQMQEAIWSMEAVASVAIETAGAYPASAAIIPGELDNGVAADPGHLAAGSPDVDAALLPGLSKGPSVALLALQLVTFVWIAGAVACLASQLRRIARHAALVRRGQAAPELLTSEIQSVAGQLGLRPPRALVAREIVSPFMWCLGQLRLVWPECLSSKAEVLRSRGVIAHELAHVRRGDHLVAWLELCAGIVWWWNPLFWFVRRRLRETAEMACDALAIDTCPENRREYAELLLALSAGCKTGAPAPVLAVSAGTPSSFERRLSMILSDRVSGKLSLCGILAALSFALAALPAWSLGQQRPAKERPPLADAPKSSPAEDALLRELIESGKFAKAKERLDALRKKQEGDKEAARRELEKWKAAKIKELPHYCVSGLKENVTLAWTSCKTCHSDPWGEDYEKELTIVPHTKWKLQFLNDTTDAKGEAAESRSLVGFKGTKRFYVVTFEGRGGTITAFNIDDGKTLWKSQIADSLPKGTSEDQWSLTEGENKELVLSWNRKDGRTNFYFESGTGKILRKETGAGADQGKASDAGVNKPGKNTAVSPLPPEAARAQREADKAEIQREFELYRKTLTAGQKEAAEAQRAAAEAAYQRAFELYKKLSPAQDLEATSTKRQPSQAQGENRSDGVLNTLDLAERYLRALADLKNATSKHARLQKLAGTGTVPDHQLEESKIELERVQKLEKLLSSFMEDELKAAQAAKEKAQNEYLYAERLHAKGYQSDAHLEAMKFRLEAAEIRFRQLDSIRSAVSPAADDSKTSTGGSGTGSSRSDGKAIR